MHTFHKKLSSYGGNRMITKLRILSLLMIIISITLSLTGGSSWQAQSNRNIIRFHVIANSDSPKDQAIKLRVRDRLLDEFGQLLNQSPTVSQSRSIIEDKLRDIEGIAQEEVDRYTKVYKVKALLGDFPFPTKAYGDMVYPAGNYEALRIIIGSGQGANWWCVMFPPLCFVDISHSITEDEGDEGPGSLNKGCELEDGIGYEEGQDDAGSYDSRAGQMDNNGYQMDNKDYETRIEYRFKLMEWWEEIIGKF